MANNNTNKGFIFYKNSEGIYFYINKSREHIFLGKDFIKLINEDKIYKDIIRQTAKEYTLIGYNRIINKLPFTYNNIMGDNSHVVMTCWLSINDFNKEIICFD